jgi:8-oxo-dGTP pyrophosphatase MutT (NUDIX family)
METIDLIRAALRRPLPGRPAQLTMAPYPRPLDPPPGVQPRRAGVLLLLYPVDGVLYLVFTARAAHLNYHGGQVSFPGGGWEEGDATLQDTALREACEELGVCRGDMEGLGPLTPLYVLPSNNLVHPFVAYTPERPAFRPDPHEVAGLLEVPLERLFDPRLRREEVREREEGPLHVPFFALGENQVWGATAAMLAEFTAALAPLIPSATPPPPVPTPGA